MELWWLPSLIVFGGSALVIVLIVTTVRRRTQLSRGHTRGAIGPLRAPLADLERDAGIALVRADDALSEARDELGFAVAQFGEEATRDFAEAVRRAADDIRAAFLLRQRLDDHEPESDAKRRELSLRIMSHCGTASQALAQQSSHFLTRRRTEAVASERASELAVTAQTVRRRIDALDGRITDAAQDYDSTVIGDVRTMLRSAREELTAADSALADASAAAAANRPAGDVLVLTEQRLGRAERQAADAEASLTGLQDARTQLAADSDNLTRLLESARTAQATAVDPDFAAELGSAIAEASSAQRALTARGGAASSRDPAHDRRALDDAADRVEAALAAVRTQQARLDGARAALPGALRIAATQLESATRIIDGNRARLGPSARARLTEAQRQLSIAHDLADPVEALDVARRAARLAEDATALAHFDLR